MNVEMSVLCEPPSFPFPEVSEPAVAPTRPAPRPPVAGFRRKAIAIPATTAEMPAVVVRTKAISSFAQELMWLLDQMAAEKAAYNVPRFLQITGPLNIAALEWALNGLVGRHEALRTTFTWADGHLEQVILPVAQAAVTIDVVDLHVPDAAHLVRRRVYLDEDRDEGQAAPEIDCVGLPDHEVPRVWIFRGLP